MSEWTKTCSKCEETKPIKLFNLDKSRGDGHAYWCKSCCSIYNRTDARIKTRQESFKKRDPVVKRRHHLKTMYNMTLEQYDELFDEQNGCCAICGLPESNHRLCVDHDHKTGKIRGLLCHNCNKGLGHFFDSVENLEVAKSYLLKRRTN